MHVYLYESFVNTNKYNNILARIETRATDLGLNGKIIRLGVSFSVSETIENEIKKGAKTIIVVGSDLLEHNAVNVIAKLSSYNVLAKDVPLGIIPIGKNNLLAKYFGIPAETLACDVLSARRIETLDLGSANQKYFLSDATIDSRGTHVEIDQNYSIEIKEAGKISVINMPINITVPNDICCQPNDGILELAITASGGKRFLSSKSKKKHSSFFSFTDLTILNKTEPVIIDNQAQLKAPVNIKLANEKIKIIVGKDRGF